MRVLWITNLPMAEAQEYLFHKNQVKEGWLVQLSQLLSKHREIELHVASRTAGLSEEKNFTIGSVTHHCYPAGYTKDEKTIECYWKKLIASISPDIAHLQGTESIQAYSFVMACPEIKTVASIQGLTSVILRYFFGGIPEKELCKFTTMAQAVLHDRMVDKYHRMEKSGELEKEILKRVNYVIGRTEWDKCHTVAINPQLHYFSCGEIMRPSFYDGRWTPEKCSTHSIFVTQGLVPYKGFHMVLNAMPYILRKYPDTKIKVALLPKVRGKLTVKERLLGGEYMYYTRALIEKLGLDNCIDILGSLSEKEMVQEMLNCHVFVSPSAIENSPNSVCEAQLLGVPTIVSNVGGTESVNYYPSKNNMYRYEEYEMLADKIVNVFNGKISQSDIEHAIITSREKHNPSKISERMIEIYNIILQ